jgi:UDP-GlcNAc:undecaprenyl-phosphate GlcNAc-1-phosphate transferase
VAFTTGLVDDLRRLRPYQKLAGQVLAAAVLLLDGVTFRGTGWPPLDCAITLFWLVGITNALNLLDNMDGLAAGVATVAAGFLAVDCWLGGQPGAAEWLAAFAGALLGFLVYNSHPASIFMGDGGALFIGIFLAALALVGKPAGDSAGPLSVAVPVLILAVPIFDTTLVTVCRKLAGRAASQGGRDHTSHRLVALGLSERQAVWLLYGLAALAGSVAMGVRTVAVEVGLLLTAGFVVLLILFGLFLGRIPVYGETERP